MKLVNYAQPSKSVSVREIMEIPVWGAMMGFGCHEIVLDEGDIRELLAHSDGRIRERLEIMTTKFRPKLERKGGS